MKEVDLDSLYKECKWNKINERFDCSLTEFLEQYILTNSFIEYIFIDDFEQVNESDNIRCLVVMDTHEGNKSTHGVFNIPHMDRNEISAKFGLQIEYEMSYRMVSARNTLNILFGENSHNNFILIKCRK